MTAVHRDIPGQWNWPVPEGECCLLLPGLACSAPWNRKGSLLHPRPRCPVEASLFVHGSLWPHITERRVSGLVLAGSTLGSLCGPLQRSRIPQSLE